MYQPKRPVRRHCFYRLNPRVDRFVRNLEVFWANPELAWLSQLMGKRLPTNKSTVIPPPAADRTVVHILGRIGLDAETIKEISFDAGLSLPAAL
jgi:hypothetical protein